jgi:hypothetical protein
MIIFNYVRSSTTVTKNNPQQTAHRRDLHLLRHMIIMFCIFVGGWSPIYVYSIADLDFDFGSLLAQALFVLAISSIIFDIMNLFLYNHELRKYLQQKIFRRP